MASKAYKIAFKLDAMLSKGFDKTFSAAESRAMNLADSLGSAGKAMTLGVTAPLLAIGTGAIAIAADYEQSMNTIRARTQMAAYQVDELSDSFRAMAVSGNYGAFSAREIASAYAEVAVKGHDAEHATEIMRMSMVLASAVGDDLGKTASFLGEYLQKVGKDASDAEKYINLFAAANQRTQMPLSKLQDYLFRANASLQAAGISGTEATAVFSELYFAGVKGANAYSGFQQAIESLLLPSENQLKVMNELGISFHSAEWQAKSTMDQFFALGDALDNVTDGTRRLDMMSTLFTQQSARAFTDELFNQRDSLRGVIPELYEAANATSGMGAAFQMAEEQNQGLANSAKQLRVSLEEIMLQIAEHLMPHAQALVDFVGRWINYFASLDEGTQRVIITIAAVAAAIGPVLMIASKLIKTTIKVKNTITKVVAVMKTLATASKLVTAAEKAREAATHASTNATMAAEKAERARNVLGKNHVKTKMLSVKASKAQAAATALNAKAQAAEAKVTKVAMFAIKAKTIAMKILNMVMMMNPIFAIIAGIIALGAAIAGLIVWLSRKNNSYKELAESASNLRERQEELAESAAAAAAEYEASVQAIAVSNAHMRDMADTITALSAQCELLPGDLATMTHYIEQLNESMPGLNLAFCEYTGALNMTTEALENYLAVAEHQAKLTAQLEERTRLAEEALVLERELAEAMQLREYIEAKLADGTRRSRNELRTLASALDDAQTAEAGFTESLAENARMQEELTININETSAALESYEEVQREAARAAEEAAAQYDILSDQLNDIVGQMNDLVDAYNRSYDAALRSVQGQYQLWDQAAQVVAKSSDTINSGLESQIAYWQEYNDNIANLSERTSDIEGLSDMISSFADGSAASVNAIAGMADASDECLAIMVANWKTLQAEQELVAHSLAELETDFSNSMASLTNDLETTVAAMALNDEAMAAGRDTIQSFVDGMNDMLPAVTAAAAAIAAAAIPGGSGGGPQVHGSHSEGLAYVPFDGYIAELHKGERVLTAEENVLISPYLMMAMSSLSSFNKHSNLSSESSGGSNFKPAPIDHLNKMNSSPPPSSGSGGFVYNVGGITINGSGLSADELEAILERRLDAEREKMEDCFYDYIDAMSVRSERLSNE